MNISKILSEIDTIMFAKNGYDRSTAYAEVRGALLTMQHNLPSIADVKRDLENELGLPPEQLPKVKPIDGKPKRKPPRQSIPSEIAWEQPCPKCGVMGGSPCRSIGPLNSGKVTKHMHPERCGATTRLNQRITQSGSSKSKKVSN